VRALLLALRPASDYVPPVRRYLAVVLICALALLVGAASPARADVITTELPFTSSSDMVVDPVGKHVFVSGGPGASSIVVLDFSGNIVKTITGEDGASQMALDSATHTLYVALHDANAISEIDTTTLAETTRFSTAYPDPTSLVLAGDKLWFSCFQDDGTNCDGSIASADLDGTNQTQPISGWFFATVLAAGGTTDNLLAVADTYQEPSAVSVYDVSGNSPSLVSNLPSYQSDLAFVNGMAFDPSGANLLLTSGGSGRVESRATSTLLLNPNGQYPIGAYPTAVAISPDGTEVAGGVNKGTNFPSEQTDVYVYPTNETTPLRTWWIGNYEVPPNSLAFSPDGSDLFALADNPSSGHVDFYVLGIADPPDTEIAGGPSGTAHTSTAKFDFTSHDTAATFQCSFDGSTPQPCTSPVTYSDLASGSHKFKVQAVDGTSIDPSGASQTWTVQPPDTTLLSGPDSETTDTTATFTFTSDDENSDSAGFQCSLDSAAWSPCMSPQSYSDLARGSHTFTVRAVDGTSLVDPTGASQTWTIEGPPEPLTAELTASAGQILTGEQLTLDASGSGVSPGNIVDYQWDLGNGSFDQDSGSSPTITTSFASPGPRQVRVKVTDDLGASAIASVAVDVGAAPPPGPVGVSINNGDYATNSPDVQLDVVWPAFAANALISNDGGFGPSGETTTIPVAATIPWTLASNGSDRLPQFVYLRFPDSANPLITFSDNIVLDTTTPTVKSATSSRSGKAYKVRLKANEKISGISAVRISHKRGGGTLVTLRDNTTRGILKLSRTVTVKMRSTPKWVRARSAAGNWSKWHAVKKP
jgi:hypothetical protein